MGIRRGVALVVLVASCGSSQPLPGADDGGHSAGGSGGNSQLLLDGGTTHDAGGHDGAGLIDAAPDSHPDAGSTADGGEQAPSCGGPLGWGAGLMVAFSPDASLFAIASPPSHIEVRHWPDDVLLPYAWNGLYGATAIAFSGDGSLLAAATSDAVKLWRVSDGVLVKRISAIPPGSTSIAVSSDGAVVAAMGAPGSSTGGVQVWQEQDGSTMTFAPGVQVQSFALSSDGAQLATTADDQVTIWSSAGGAPVWNQAGFAGRVLFSPNGSILAAQNPGGGLAFADLTSGATWSSGANVDQLYPTYPWAFSPDGAVLAADVHIPGVFGGSAAPGLVNVADGTVTRTAPQPLSPLAVGLGPGLVIRSVDPLDALELVEDGTLVATQPASFTFPAFPQAYVAISPDGHRVATGGDGSHGLWDADTLSGGVGTGDSGYYGRPTFSPDGQVFFAHDTHITDTLNVVDTGVTIDALTASDQVLVLGNADGTAALRELRTLALRLTFSDATNGHTMPVTSVALSHDGLTLATGSADQTIKLWSTSTGAFQKTLSGAQGEILSVVFTTDDTRLLSADGHGDLRLWSVGDGSTTSMVNVPTASGAPLTGAVISPDDRIVYFGAAAVGRYRLPDWTRLPDLLGHTAAISSLALSADGTRLVSGSNDVGARDDTARLYCVGTDL